MSDKNIIFLLLLLFQFYSVQSYANTGIVSYTQSAITKISTRFGGSEGFTTFDKYPRFTGDIDGDGLDDIIACANAGVYVLFNEGNNQFTDQIYVSSEFGYLSSAFAYTSFNLYPRQVGDIDGDGKADIIGFRDDGVYVAFSNGRQMMESSIKIYSGMGVSAGGWSSFNTYPRFVGDIDGDGKADLVGYASTGVYVSFSNGRTTVESEQRLYSGYCTQSTWTDQNTYPRGIADINGDGKMDIIGHHSSVTYVSLSTGRGLGGAYQYNNLSLEYTHGSGWSSFDRYPRYYGDVNGDGRMDIIGYASSGAYIGITQTSNKLEGVKFYIKTPDYGVATFPYQNTHTRLVGDINNDGLKDLVAFQSDGTYYSQINTVCSHSTRDPYNLCNCKKGYGEMSANGECRLCNSNCASCQYIAENCIECKGKNRLAPSCGCDIGFYDDGVSDDCIPCDYKCGQCSFLPDEFPVLIGVGGIKHETPVLQPSAVDPLGNTGTVYRAGYNVYPRFGSDAPNNVPIINVGDTYQFCIWIRLVNSGWVSTDFFQLDIDDRVNRIYKTDKDGNVLVSGDSSLTSSITKFGLTTDWQRYCVNAYDDNIQQYHFIDLANSNPNRLYEYSLPQLQKIKSVDMGPQPYTVGQTTNQCQECSHYTRTGKNCECSPGYYEVSENSSECHSPKPDDCQIYIRIECSGYKPISQNLDTYANFYQNDVKIGTASSKGFNFIILDNDFQLSDQKVFNTVDTASQVTDMISFINGLPDGKVVLVATMDEVSKQMTTEAYTALQSLGMNQFTTLNFRDAFAMIGKKGSAPGTVKQGLNKAKLGGNVNLVSCIKCSEICNSCIDEINEFTQMKDIYSYETPLVNNSLQDPFGNTGTVFEAQTVGGKSLIRLGKFQTFDDQINTLFKGQSYQFSIWIRKKNGYTINNFSMDIVDRANKRYLSDQNGNILKVLDSSQQYFTDNNIITENWQKLVVNAYNDNNDYYHFIDIGQWSEDLSYEFAHPQLFHIPNIEYPPIRHVKEGAPQQGCYSCTHYARQPPLCQCQTGYTETVAGQRECQSVIPDTCSKYVRIESAGNNYAQYDNGDYLRIYMNDVEYGTFTRGITLIVLNETTFAKISQTTYDSGDSTFNPSTLISDINAIPTNRIVLVGIRGDGSQNLSSDTYTALQTLGMNSSTQIKYRGGFAMIGKKGASSSDTIQQYTTVLQGSKANVVKCLRGCDHQCSTCSGEPYSCDTCSHTTRDFNDSCNCKPTFYNVGITAECSSCISPCINCTSSTECSSCIDGKYLSGTSCLSCDNTQCATCQTNATTCILECDTTCKTCNVQAECLTCNDGKFLNTSTKLCVNCDNTKCGTCSDLTTCIQSCDSTCKTCNTLGECLSCEDGFFVNSSSKLCQACDETKCGTCTDINTCSIPCHESCKTCGIDGNCLTCDDGFYKNGNVCTVCDNTKCGTCSDISTCVISCDSSCSTCNITGKCLTCEDGKFKDASQLCDNCDNTKCGTCTDLNTCTIPCHSTCKTCGIDGHCLTCEDGFFKDGNVCTACDNTKCGTCSDLNTCDIPCGSDCSTCNLQGACITCIDGKFKDTDSQLCVDCDNTICGTCTDIDTCTIPCHNSCKTCGLDGNCLSCEDGFFKNGNVCTPCDNTKCGTCSDINTCDIPCHSSCATCAIDGQCITCEESKFVDSLNNNTCQDCEYNCQTCTGIKNQCDTCPQDTNRDQLNNCLCEIGYYDQENQNPVCLECDIQCKSCQQQADKCIECIDESRSDPPLCSCSDKFYSNQVTGNCDQCQYNCKCRQFSVCYECLGEDKDLRQIPTCHCKNGYFQDDFGICQKCDPQCKTCSDSASNCLVCEYGNNRSLKAPSCECKDKYYSLLTNDILDLNCEVCDPQCLTCESKSVCLSCVNSQFSIPLCLQEQNNTFSFSVVINGQVIEEVQSSCQPQCASCQTQAYNCTSCKIGLNRNNQPPSCECLDGYHDNNNTQDDCNICPITCKTCISNIQCLSCHPEQNRTLNQISLECECLKGYVESIHKNYKCEPCFTYKGQCFTECPQNTRQDEAQQICIEVNVNIKSQFSLIMICGCAVLLVQVLVVFIFKYYLNKKFKILNNFTNKPQIIRQKEDEEINGNTNSL